MTPNELRKKAARLVTIADQVDAELSGDPGLSPGEHHFYALAKAGLEQAARALRMAASARATGK